MAAPDMTVVTAALDFASVVGSVLGVAASFVSLYVVIKGAAIVVCAVYGDSGNRVPQVSGRVPTMADWNSLSDESRFFLGVCSFEDYSSRYRIDD